MTNTWKEFEKNETSHSVAHHLMTIYELRREQGYARPIDVSRRLNISRGSASITLKTLREKGLIEEDENRFLRLSAGGRSLAKSILARRALLQRFFTDVLGVSTAQAEIDACKMEHLISRESSNALAKFLQTFSQQNESQISVNSTININENTEKK